MASHPSFEAETDLIKLHELIATDPSQINTQDDDTKIAPLHIAAEYGLVGAVVELLRADAKFGVQDREGRTPLITATENKHAVVVEQLLKALSEYESVKSQLEMPDNLGRTPLLWASIVDFPEGVELLIDAGADSNARTLESKSTPLIAASSLGHQGIAELLLKSNPDGRAYLNHQDADGGTALHAAVIGEHFKIAELLLNAGADFNIEDKNGQRPLHLASEQGNKSLVNLLLKAGSLVNEPDKHHRTPLHLAIDTLHKLQSKLPFDQSDLVDLMVEGESNMQPRSDGCIQTIHLLLDSGARPEALTREGNTALHLAVACGEPLIIEGVMKRMKPEDLLLRNQTGKTALSSIFQHQGERRATMVRVLFESDLTKVAVFYRTDEWKDILKWAANDPKSHDIVKLLLRKRPRRGTNLPLDSQSWSAIRWAAYEQLPEVLSSLISTSPETPETREALSSALMSTLDLIKEPYADSREASDQLPIVLWLLITAFKQTSALQEELRKALEAIKTSQHQQKPLSSAQKSRMMDRKDIFVAQVNDLTHQGSDAERHNNESQGGLDKQKRQSTQKSLEGRNLETIKGILHDPPFARVHKEPTHYDISQPEKELHEVLDEFKASIVQFSRANGLSKTVQFTRTVHEVIYKTGPAKLTETVAAMHKAVYDLDKGVGETEPDFIWVHLPATNTGIPRCANTDGKTDRDREQEKRACVLAEDMMREPEQHKGDDKTKAGWPKPNGHQENDSERIAASAIYMPHLCFSVNLDEVQGETLEKKTRYERLLAKYGQTDSPVHGSPTLDEWYYQFTKNDNTTEKERLHRNNGQVVTRFLKETRRLGPTESELRILRVNQIWIWTIKNMDELLDRLSKQTEYGGRNSQPKSADEMRRLIVEYCIGSYEKSSIETDPSNNQEKQKLSISQIYSNYLNRIGRKETSISEALLKDPGSSLQFENAYDLYIDVKDVRDELNILKSVAQHQEVVERGFINSKAEGAELSAAYMAKNIAEMDIVAERIQSAVNTSLSLQQSETANKMSNYLMVFTFATLLFLPLSFISSLFALDVSSFLRTPDWAFVVLFLVSIAISGAVLLVVFYRESLDFVVKMWEKLVSFWDRSEDDPQPAPERGSQDSLDLEAGHR
ncbi:hypothetical protein CNYM01_04327 [Colletotrichum nymphaeae SA-01]|uniref:Uncharacterized protein n=1 Tax=Colletotrichum nymphaeae SA-01 TaxID=1460502 RepID=A0A135UK64_9PEZI|nr:hypothetical protein CNYM01_04327 [Colletotrichum nymphaeae SA-01]